MYWICFCIPAFLFVNQVTGCVPQSEIICIRNYEELENYFRNNSDNMEAIQKAFYPPNRAESNVVTVKYCITCDYDIDANDTTTCNATIVFQWMDENFLLPIDFSVLRALTLGVADLNKREVQLFIDPFCEGVNGVDELTTLTSWLKNFVTRDDSDIIRGYALVIQVNGTFINPSHSSTKTKALAILILLLLVSSIACCVTLHCGRINGGLVHNKLCDLFKETEESYKQLLHLMTIFRVITKQILQKKIDKDAKYMASGKLKLNSREEKVKVEQGEQVESDDCKPVFLANNEEIIPGTIERLFSFENPLSYLSQLTVNWCILAFIVITCFDIHYSNHKNTFRRTQWLLSPVPVWALVIFIPNFIVTVLIQVCIYCSNKGERFECNPYSLCGHFYQLVVTFCITSLPLYAIFHGVWISIVFVSFPFRFIPFLVFISFLLSGGKWLTKNVCFVLTLYREAKKHVSTERKLLQNITFIVNKTFSVDGRKTFKLEESQSTLSLHSDKNSKLQSLMMLFNDYKFMISLVASQFIVFIIWILAQVSVYSFSDTIQDASNLADSPLTAIIGAVVISKLFSDVMNRLSPQGISNPGFSQHLKNCKITKIVYICTRCKSCNFKSPPSQGDEESVESGKCTECGVTKSTEPVTRVIVTSDTQEVSVFVSQHFISEILGEEESSSPVNSTYNSTDLNNIESRLLEAPAFSMTLNENEVLSIVQVDSIYEFVDM